MHVQSNSNRLLEQQPDGRACPLRRPSSDSCVRVPPSLARSRGNSNGRAWSGAPNEPAPPARMWIALRAQLESEGLIPSQRPRWPGWLAGSARRSRLRLALAGAYLSLAVGRVAGAVVRRIFHRLRRPSRGGAQAASVARRRFRRLTSDQHARRRHEARHGLASRAQYAHWHTSLQQNLGIVDNLIAVCEKSVREQPDNPMARDYLYGAYQQKASCWRRPWTAAPWRTNERPRDFANPASQSAGATLAALAAGALGRRPDAPGRKALHRRAASPSSPCRIPAGTSR